MPSIFNSLNIGYTGLTAAQVGINTTGHNVANAGNKSYTRQRVVTAANTPITTRNGSVGNGTAVQDIKRVFDNFVFDRYSSAAANKENSDYKQKTLKTLSTYFPEIAGVGVKADLANYYNAWQTFANNPSNDAIKVNLAKETQNLATHIKQTRDQVFTLQSQVNAELATNVNQVNDLASQLAKLNTSIDNAEVGGGFSANDLRDKRNVLEKTLSRVIGATVTQGNITANTQINSNSNTRTGSYTLNVDGFNIVDGNTFHPLKLTKKSSQSGFYDVSYERQDGVLIPLNDKITGGKIGAIFALRGTTINTTSGVPADGVLQNVVSQLDSFAKGLIESTNNLYAANSTTNMLSNNTKIDLSNRALTTSPLNIKQGAFDMVVYNLDGQEVARRSINIDNATVMSGAAGSNSIEGQLKANIDDNNDGNANNNINNFINFNYNTAADGTHNLELTMDPLSKSKGYTFSIADKLKSTNFSSGSNFAGALGLGNFFEGDSAKNINLKLNYINNPTLISAGLSGIAGDNKGALNMVQHQFENYDFNVGANNNNATTYGMFDIIATNVGVNTNAAILKNETVTTQYNATQLEYFSTSKVNIDEEMTNLIKYQTSYGAAAKVIKTVDQMMQTLLGIK